MLIYMLISLDLPMCLFFRLLFNMRLDSNSLAGEVPEELTNLKSLSELYLSNNNLIRSVPDLLGMKIEYNVLNSQAL
ncbi:putative leucine-rich repeat domain superfamily [Helianthus anomalus]